MPPIAHADIRFEPMPRATGYPSDDFDDHDDDFDDDDENAVDEAPSSQDIEALDHESGTCPDCGAEVWDAAEICPKCYAYLGGNTFRPSRLSRQAKIWLLVALAIAVGVAGVFFFSAI